MLNASTTQNPSYSRQIQIGNQVRWLPEFASTYLVFASTDHAERETKGIVSAVNHDEGREPVTYEVRFSFGRLTLCPRELEPIKAPAVSETGTRRLAWESLCPA